MTSTKSERIYIEKYQEKGYDTNFRVRDNKLIPDNKDASYKINDFKIVAQNRFEGMSNPADLSILYVIETSDHIKGTILVAYGSASDTETAEFFKDVPDEHISNDAMIII